MKIETKEKGMNHARKGFEGSEARVSEWLSAIRTLTQR